MLRLGPTECSKAMTSQSYYENRISGIRNILAGRRDDFLLGVWLGTNKGIFVPSFAR